MGVVTKKATMARNYLSGGMQQFSGTLRLSAAAVPTANRRVYLIHRIRWLVADDTYTDDNGHYEFTRISRGPWRIIGDDDPKSPQYNSDIICPVITERMPPP